MVRYVIALILGLATPLLGAHLAGGRALLLLNATAFLIVCAFPFLMVSAVFGFGEMRRAFEAALKGGAEKVELERALAFFGTLGKSAWLAALIGFIVGIVNILASLGDLSALGPSAAVLLLAPLYAAIVGLVVVVPFSLMIRKRL
ncbi:MAG: MotA/TolQ/ExbB proton channel family protein [Treponema sp.]|nr:MotA/TolQ/ExbB proton channel family protein [Treponema sp.]